MSPRRLDYPLVTRLLARSLGLSPSDLEASFGPASRDELDALTHLRTTHEKSGHRPDDLAYLQWRYDFTGEDPGRSIWVFRRGYELVGTLGVERDLFTYKGEGRCEIHRLMDILAREDHMGSGLGVWMNLRLQQVFPNTLCIGSTPYSHSIVTGLNTTLPDWQTWRYPISLRRRSSAFVVVDALLRLQRGLFRLLVLPGSRLVEHGEPLQATAALRDSMTEHLIMPSRGIERSEWRFGAHPLQRYTRFALTHRDEPVAALTISRLGLRAEISDALVRMDDAAPAAKVLADLLTLVVARLADEGTEVVTTRVNDPITASALRRAGFIRRDEPFALGYTFQDETPARWMEEGIPLFLMPADSDLD